MPAWLMPTLKAILPHVGNIVSAASPAFNRRAKTAANQVALLQEQIHELQAVAATHDGQIKQIAEQLQKIVGALETSLEGTERRHRSFQVLGIGTLVSAVLAVTALIVALTT